MNDHDISCRQMSHRVDSQGSSIRGYVYQSKTHRLQVSSAKVQKYITPLFEKKPFCEINKEQSL